MCLSFSRTYIFYAMSLSPCKKNSFVLSSFVSKDDLECKRLNSKSQSLWPIDILTAENNSLYAKDTPGYNLKTSQRERTYANPKSVIHSTPEK